ncbi:MAG: acyl--CoA ligase [Clostridiales bacterium]|nr:acyl--CoA ligase [Clostridiales bacterium]OPZ66942.1 MAG: Long-chain-fatty-acid--CoA ligase FadD13 [Firmicutes bacterium ADurb.Bin467]
MNEYFWNMLDPEDRARLRRPWTVPELLDLCRDEFFDLPAVNTAEGSITYGELLESVAKLRGTLDVLGIPKGAHVGLLMPNSARFIELFLAIASSGRVAVPMPAALAGDALKGAWRMLGLEAVFYTGAPRGEELRLCDANALPDAGPIPAAAVSKDEPCAIFFTGGTTGRPKGAVLSHGAMLTGAFNGAFSKGRAFEQRYYGLIPFSHVFGLIRNFLTCVLTGSSIYPCEDMRNLFADLPKARPTILVLVPALAEMMLGVVSLRGLNALGGCVETIICGGAPVPPKLIRRYDALGIRVLPGYGLTETANLVSGNGDSLERPDSVGKPYAGQELRFVDGELWLRGENLMLGYHNNPEENARAFEDKWFRTGDLGHMDADGYLYITGRLKNILVLANGEKLSPEVMEAELSEMPEIRECLVRLEEREILCVEAVPSPGTSPDKVREAVERWNQNQPEFRKIRRVHVRDTDLPRTPSMKIAR